LNDLELARLLISVVGLLVMAFACGRLFERLGMPHVVGEIVGGLLLGPTFLGHFFPAAYAWTFQAFPTQAVLLSSFYWLGLILLMFVAGFSTQRKLSGDDRFLIGVMLAASVVFPMLGGWFLDTLLDRSTMMNPTANPVSFSLVLAIGTAVTSIPVISRIFIDLGLMGTRFAKIVVATATLQDLFLWTMLAIATGLNSGTAVNSVQLGTVVLTTLFFIALSVFLGPPLLTWIGRRLPIKKHAPALAGYAILVCFALTAVAALLHINVVFGALVAGVVIGSAGRHEALNEVKQRISDIAIWFFVPIYFALVGLKIDLPNQFDWWMATVFIVASSALKFASICIAMRVAGQPMMTAINYGIAMNTRGGPGIVLASVAFAFNIITERFFVTLILASILTSLVSGVWLRFMVRRGYAFDA
jgi:Kef-type K+ transport system membrane component KefB